MSEEKENSPCAVKGSNGRADMLLGFVVHELKTPLTSMLASAELLEESLEKKHATEVELKLIKNILRSVSTMDTRLSELMDWTRLQEDGFHPQLISTNIAPLLQKVVDQYQPLIEKKHQSLAMEVPDVLPMVVADPERLEQVIANLLSNANKFTPQNGNVTLRARQTKNDLVVEVQDTGIGLSREKQNHLFQPYYRGRLAKEDSPPGLGLGLAISKQLVETQQGKIWVESKEGNGSIFAFSLPLAKKAQSAKPLHSKEST